MYLLFISLLLAVFGGLNFYVGLRGWQYVGSKAPFLDSKVYWAAFTLMVLFGTIGIIAGKVFPDFLRKASYLTGSYWLVAMTYFFLAAVLADLLRVLDRWLGFWPEGIKSNSTISWSLGLAVIFLVITLMAYGTWNAGNLRVTSYDIAIPKQAGSLQQLHIALISDTHLARLDDQRQKKIIETVNSLDPDIVLIPGDIADDIDLFEKLGMAADFQKIKSKYGVYASFGNHDYSSDDIASIIDRLDKAGIKLLRDSGVKVADSFYIIGREDRSYEMYSGKKRMELSRLMQGLDSELPVILLDHQPSALKEAEEAGVDLQLSGHTHQGQLFPINLITNQVFTVDYGHLQTGNLQVIVTSGAGTWGPPVRIGTSSEVADITVSFLP